VVPREERHHRSEFTASREEERTPIHCGPQGPKPVTVTPGRRRGATVEFTALREEERTPRPCGREPETCDGGTREEERCHRRVHGIQGGGEDAETVWA
jgi:hypothetical protein